MLAQKEVAGREEGKAEGREEENKKWREMLRRGACRRFPDSSVVLRRIENLSNGELRGFAEKLFRAATADEALEE